MKLQIAKWGNSLAVRLPVSYIKQAGISEGDSVEASITAAGDMTLHPQKSFDKAAFMAGLNKLQANMPMTEPVVEQLRNEARY